MSVNQVRLCLLLMSLCLGFAREHRKCLSSASSCDECIRSGPDCAWCYAFDAKIRCHTHKGLRRAGCNKSHIYNPQGELQAVRNESITELDNAQALFLQPQEISLRLRPGVSQSFDLTITIPTGQPITELTMGTGAVPAGVNITFSSIIKGNPSIVQVNVEASQCPGKSVDSQQNQNETGPWSVNIKPKGFSLGVKLEITLDCQCDCISKREESSLECSRHGALLCGQCNCSEPYYGERCEWVAQIRPQIDDSCRLYEGAPVCSGKGKCVWGSCECDMPENPREKYSGPFCECSNFDCPYHNNRLCGGHGSCECRLCICDNNWTGQDCRCSMETASCMANNGMLCNGIGMCDCGVCKCQPPYTGPTCEDCPLCHG